MARIYGKLNTAKMQAALYYARKRRRQRQIASVHPLDAYIIDGDAPTLVMDAGEAVYGLDGIIEPQATVIPLTRATIGTYVGSDGLLKTAAIDELRLDHDKNGNIRGVFIEGAATNVETDSNGMASLGGLNSVATADASAGWSGVVDMVELRDDSSGGTGLVGLYSGVKTVTNSTQYCWSEVFKKGSLTWVGMQPDGFTTPANNRSYFDIENGVVGTKAVQHDDSGIEDLGNGLVRCWVVFTTDAVDTGGTLRVFLASGDLNLTVPLDGTSYLYLGDRQFEIGSKPTSYIETTGVAVTRAEDVSIIALSEFSYDIANVTILVEAEIQSGAGIDATLVSIWQQNGEYINLFNDSSDIVRAYAVNDSNWGAPLNPNSGQDITSAMGRVAFAASDNDAAISANGSTVVTDVAGLLPNAVTHLYFGRLGNGNNYLNARLKKVLIYSVRISNPNLETWTN